MISANSLSAFSGATATAPLNRSSGVRSARLLRGEDKLGAPTQPSAAVPLSGAPPKGPLPRGSLLNLAV